MVINEFEKNEDAASSDALPQHDTNGQKWKKEIGEACMRWVDSLDDYKELEDAHCDETPDLYALFSALGSLQTETRKLSRKSVESLSTFENTLSDINCRLTMMQSLNQAQESLRLISIIDRIERIGKQLKKTPPKKLFFNDTRWESLNQSVLQAMELLLENCHEVLKISGVKKFVSSGMVFDPSCMVAIEVGFNDAIADNTVVEEITPGYFYNGTVLRYSEVKVNRKK